MFDFLGRGRRLGTVVVGVVAVLVAAFSYVVTRPSDDDKSSLRVRADQRSSQFDATEEEWNPPTVSTTPGGTNVPARPSVTVTSAPPRPPVDPGVKLIPAITVGAFEPGRIAYESGDNVYSVKADGSDVVLVGEAMVGPSWSPRRAGFVATAKASRHLVVRDQNGRTTQLSDGDDAHPAWSPNGKFIAFSRFDNSGAGEGCCAIWTMKSDGTDAHRVADSVCINSEPAWTPDSKQIVFWSSRNYCSPDAARGWGNYELFIVNADGTGLKQLDTLSNSGNPSVSPDGKRVVFASDRMDHHADRPGTWDIWIMNLDGTGQVRISDDLGNEEFPAWSPDGTRIVFRSDRDGGGLFTMTPDGGDVRHIVTGDATNPAW